MPTGCSMTHAAKAPYLAGVLPKLVAGLYSCMLGSKPHWRVIAAVTARSSVQIAPSS